MQIGLFLILFFYLFNGGIERKKSPVKTSLGHQDRIRTLGINPDGNLLISAGNDRTIRVWDYFEGQELRVWGEADLAITQMQLFQNGKKAVVGYKNLSNSRVKLKWGVWDLEKGIPAFEEQSLFDMSDIKLDTAKQIGFIAPQYRFDIVQLVNLLNGSVINSIKSADLGLSSDYPVSAICWLPKKSKLYFYKPSKSFTHSSFQSVSIQENIVKEINSYQILYDYKNVLNMIHSADERWVIYSGSNGNLGWISTANSENSPKNLKISDTPLYSLDAHPTKPWIITGDANGFVYLVNLEEKKVIASRKISTEPVAALAFHPKEDILSVAVGNEIKVISASELYVLYSFNGNTSHAKKIEIDSEFKTISGVFNDQEFKRFDFKSGQLGLKYSPMNGKGSSYHISSSKKFHFTGDTDGTIYLWETNSNRPLKSIKIEGESRIKDISLSPDEQFVAVLGNSNLYVYDFSLSKLIKKLSVKGNDTYFVNNEKLVVSQYPNPGIISIQVNEWTVGSPYLTGLKINAYSTNLEKSFLAATGSMGGAYFYSTDGSMSRLFTVPWIVNETFSATSNSHYIVLTSGNRLSWSGRQIQGNDSDIAVWTQATEQEWANRSLTGEKPAFFIGGHQAKVTQSGFLDDSLLVTAGEDGKIQLFDLNTKKEKAKLLLMKNQDYVLEVNTGFYMGTKTGAKSLFYASNSKVTTTFEQFDLILNRPDKVLESIGYGYSNLSKAYKKAWEKRIRTLGLNPESIPDKYSDELVTSQITIVSPKTYFTETKEENISIQIKAQDLKVGLSQIQIVSDDVPLFGKKGIELSGETKFNKTVTISLMSGINRLEAYAVNKNGIKSRIARFIVFRNVPPEKPNVYVLAIGISNFENEDMNLTYPSKDARDLVALFESQNDSFNHVKTKTLLDKDATTSSILQAKSFLNQAKPNDIAIIHIATHGILDKELNNYLATYTTDWENPKANGLPYEDFETLFDGLPVRKRLVLIDACHAGEADKEDLNAISDSKEEIIQTAETKVKFRGLVRQGKAYLGTRNSFALMQQLFADFRSQTGAIVISAAGAKEFAIEDSRWKNGIFTYSILQGLMEKTADFNKDGSISVTELRDYSIDMVPKLTNGQQHPTSRAENLSNDFRVW